MLKTPAQVGLSLPAGHIMAHNRWTGTDLLKSLRSKFTVLFIEGSESVIDFYPSSQTAVVYLTESDILALNDAKRRVAKLRKVRGVVHRVLFAKTVMTQQHFLDFQKMVVMDCGMHIFPVINDKEAGDFIARMAQQDQTPSRNPFQVKPGNYTIPIDPAILQIVMLFPKIGESRAKILIQKFKNIRGIIDAPVSDLSAVVGLSTAKSLKQFFGS